MQCSGNDLSLTATDLEVQRTRKQVRQKGPGHMSLSGENGANGCDQGFQRDIFVGIATHDEKLINDCCKIIESMNINQNRFEFQFLYGVPIKNIIQKLDSDWEYIAHNKLGQSHHVSLTTAGMAFIYEMSP